LISAASIRGDALRRFRFGCAVRVGFRGDALRRFQFGCAVRVGFRGDALRRVRPGALGMRGGEEMRGERLRQGLGGSGMARR
jgi:hypothetical protein